MKLDTAIADTLSDPTRVAFLHACEPHDVLTLLRLLTPSATSVHDALVRRSIRRAGFEIVKNESQYCVQEHREQCLTS